MKSETKSKGWEDREPLKMKTGKAGIKRTGEGKN
jgi:hypothetical protein